MRWNLLKRNQRTTLSPWWKKTRGRFTIDKGVYLYSKSVNLFFVQDETRITSLYLTLPPNQLIHFSILDEILFLSLDEASSTCAIHVPRVLNGRFQSGGSASLRLGFAVENGVLPFLSIRRWDSSQSSRAISSALGLQGQEVYLQSHDQM